MLRNSVFPACVTGVMILSGWLPSGLGPWSTGSACAAEVWDQYQDAAAGALPVNLLAPLPAALETLKIKVRRALAVYHTPRLNTRDHNTWELMHAIIAYGITSEVRNNGPMGPVINSIGCLCYNYPCKGQQLFYVDQGRVEASKGVGVQGHPGQFLAIVAQSRLAPTYPMLVEGKQFTIADLIESEKLGCQTGMELTFKLISLSHYLDPSATWKNTAGEEWSISRLIHEEIKSPINGVACGGTHRLMGMSYAVRKRGQHNQPINGEFRRAKTYTDDFHRYTLGMQNADGSFSTEWFVRSGANPDLGRRLQTTGHILEWLAYSLPEEELKSKQMIKAADYLAGILLASPRRDWEIGPLGHALHALAIYDERLFKANEEAAQVPVAEKENTEERSPKVIDQKPSPKAIADRPEPKLLGAKPAPQVLEAQPAPKAIADRPAPASRAGRTQPVAPPTTNRGRPADRQSPNTSPPAQADAGAPASPTAALRRRPANRRKSRHLQRSSESSSVSERSRHSPLAAAARAGLAAARNRSPFSRGDKTSTASPNPAFTQLTVVMG